jgi:hypothetical protein
MPGESTLEQRVSRLEAQLRITKTIGIAMFVVFAANASSGWVGAASATQLQDIRLRRIDAQVLYVGSIQLQDSQGRTRGMIDTGTLGDEPRIQLLGADQQARVSLAAGSNSGDLYLSGGKPSPRILMNASADRISPTGLSIVDRDGVHRISVGLSPPYDFGTSARIELKAGNDRPVVSMSTRGADGGLQVSATHGSIRLDSENVGSGQSEPLLSIWHAVAGKNSERIRVGIVEGQPKIETLPAK